MISFFILIIKKIILFLSKAAFLFCKGTIIAFKKYTVQSLLFLFALICAFLTVRHCKYGFFIGCRDTIVTNNYHKPCKIYQYYINPKIKEKKDQNKQDQKPTLNKHQTKTKTKTKEETPRLGEERTKQ